jgi:hypothetical protein
MKTLLSAVGMVAGLGLMALCVLVLALTTLQAMTEAGPTADPMVTVFFAIGAAAGVLLVRWASPGLFARMGRAIAAGVKWFFTVHALVNPVGLAVWVAIACSAAMALPVALFHHFFVVMAGLLFYLVITSVLLVVLPHWWLRALVTLLTAPVLLFAMMGIAEVLEPKSIGEASLAYLGPVMFHWGVVPATGLLKLIVARGQAPGTGNREPGSTA